MLSLSSTVEPLKMAMPFSSRQRDGELLPVDEVGRDGVTPAHVAPLVAEGVELEEEMVLAIEKDGAVGIVDPVGRRAEVELRLPGGCGCGCRRSGCWAAERGRAA